MLTIDVEKTGSVAVVKCRGRIVRGEEVRTLRKAVVSQQVRRIIVLDLSEVGSLDAGGLAELVYLHHWTRGRGIQLKLVNPSHFVYELLERTGLSHIFNISSLADALVILSPPTCRHATPAVAW